MSSVGFYTNVVQPLHDHSRKVANVGLACAVVGLVISNLALVILGIALIALGQLAHYFGGPSSPAQPNPQPPLPHMPPLAYAQPPMMLPADAAPAVVTGSASYRPYVSAPLDADGGDTAPVFLPGVR